MQNKQVHHGGINIIGIKPFIDKFRAVASI